MFEILDEMNVNDTNNKTTTVGVCPDLVSAQKTKHGGHVTMGVPAEIVMDLLTDKNKKAILLVVDLTEYERIKSLNP
jgi:hypothetical protein